MDMSGILNSLALCTQVSHVSVLDIYHRTILSTQSAWKTGGGGGVPQLVCYRYMTIHHGFKTSE